jgi:purine-binding chemotaxis protein CheW
MSTDWEEVRRRLDETTKALALGGSPSVEGSRAILETRARALAKEAPRIAESGETLRVVEFRLAAETYAIESEFVQEVMTLRNYTPLPSVPPFIMGVINVRGRIISLVDLKKLFDLPERGLPAADNVIVVSDDTMEFGISADAIISARTIPLTVIYPPIPTLSTIGKEYIQGIAEAHVIIIDAKKILVDESIYIRQDPE